MIQRERKMLMYISYVSQIIDQFRNKVIPMLFYLYFSRNNAALYPIYFTSYLKKLKDEDSDNFPYRYNIEFKRQILGFVVVCVNAFFDIVKNHLHCALDDIKYHLQHCNPKLVANFMNKPVEDITEYDKINYIVKKVIGHPCYITWIMNHIGCVNISEASQVIDLYGLQDIGSGRKLARDEGGFIIKRYKRMWFRLQNFVSKCPIEVDYGGFEYAVYTYCMTFYDFYNYYNNCFLLFFNAFRDMIRKSDDIISESNGLIREHKIAELIAQHFPLDDDRIAFIKSLPGVVEDIFESGNFALDLEKILNGEEI